MDATTVRIALIAGIAIAALMHGVTIASGFGLIFVSWWAIPVHLGSVWFAGNMARNRRRNPNIGHALGVWLGVLGPLVALGLDQRSEADEDAQGIELKIIMIAIPAGAAGLAIVSWAIIS